MNYHYYPGCSLEGTAREYDQSTRALLAALDVQLTDIEEWTCCGASAAEATSALLSLALPARNLALAERAADAMDVLVPCSACYLNLKTVAEKVRSDAPLAAQINSVLGAEQLHLAGRLRVRHLLDVLATDVGPAAIHAKVARPLNGLRIAPYYGCQCLRPYADFDDPERPVSMEPLIRAAGAEVFPWHMGGRCCGASHMNTQREVGAALVAGILEAGRGADAIATVCPMCQMNLEAFQGLVGRTAGQDLHISVLYLPQLIGLALGLDAGALGLDLNLALQGEVKRKLGAANAAEPAAGPRDESPAQGRKLPALEEAC
jgi:heterodisulfide reductase subunit B